MANITIVNDQGVEVKPTQMSESIPDDMGMGEGEIGRLSVAQVFDLDPKETRSSKEDLDTLLEWAKTKTDDHSMQNIKWTIRQLEDRLGSPPLAEKRLSRVVRFATLDLQSKQIEREKESLYDNR